ncbi:SDR family oxidoreductase [Chitinophaga ginsengisegetis]|uniref:SDR family oxidoreductase n=1 Tax=Chitinophaga ginsengisegetis TaxID=393003 RepID=UPI000DBA9489|nr:SDR family oxidoreductase [Chitinophaga ginsengisegetis]MDR6568294.1 NADP-dependent 3-hydroxy acid dehydrogenase YdfG [Chitinophaga ginsengisegetis]MDR6648475.1 NADP-dependent 3-hydroxy acid dehydrogenase YdfG [Chitinophaga ginsengisegetis]MDR6654375.1 NADP-dependent 3-hydroxy acid dehydrogenase YdfG [Chitinophaga ginsengisegetis]
MSNLIEGKVVAISGAGSGIGKAIAINLSKLGARVVLGGRRKELLEAVAKEINQTGGEATAVMMDVRHQADAGQLVAAAMTKYGRLDVLVNNAGVAQLSRIDELDIAGWEDMIDINLKGVLYCMAAAIPVFRQQQSGHIVNIISTSGIKIVPMQGVYAATKNAVRTLTEAFRQESDGTIRITGISPGVVKTDFSHNMKNPQMREAIASSMEQLAISPDAVAGAVAYAINQPADVEVGDIVIRPARQN